MRKFWMFIFVIALIIVAFETFRPQPAFPGADVVGALAQTFLGQ